MYNGKSRFLERGGGGGECNTIILQLPSSTFMDFTINLSISVLCTMNGCSGPDRDFSKHYLNRSAIDLGPSESKQVLDHSHLLSISLV